MTMFTKEMIELAKQDPDVAAHMEALAATAAVASLRADINSSKKADAEAEAKAEAAKAAKAKADTEAEAQADFLKAYPKGYVYVGEADEATNLINSANQVGLHARTFVEEVINNSFIKVVFMRPKKEKAGKKA